MNDNFSDYPKSLAERRADGDADASKWSPRDVLISLLREMDRGDISPDEIVVCYRQTLVDGSRQSHLRLSVSSSDATVAILRKAEFIALGQTLTD